MGEGSVTHTFLFIYFCFFESLPESMYDCSNICSVCLMLFICVYLFELVCGYVSGCVTVCELTRDTIDVSNEHGLACSGHNTKNSTPCVQ